MLPQEIESRRLAIGARCERFGVLRLDAFGSATGEALLGAPVDLVNPRYIGNPCFAAEVARTRVPVVGRAPTKAAV